MLAPQAVRNSLSYNKTNEIIELVLMFLRLPINRHCIKNSEPAKCNLITIMYLSKQMIHKENDQFQHDENKDRNIVEIL